MGRPPRDSLRLIVNRVRDVPCARCVALALVVRPIDRIATQNLYGDGFVMHHRARLDGAIERAEKQIVRHRVEGFGLPPLFRRRLEEPELIAFLLGPEDFKGPPFLGGQGRVRNAQVAQLRLDAHDDAIRAVVAKQAADPAVEEFDEFVKRLPGQGVLEQSVVNARFDGADESILNQKLAIERFFESGPMAEPA